MTNEQRIVYNGLEAVADIARKHVRDAVSREDPESEARWADVLRAIVRAQEEVAS